MRCFLLLQVWHYVLLISHCWILLLTSCHITVVAWNIPVVRYLRPAIQNVWGNMGQKVAHNCVLRLFHALDIFGNPLAVPLEILWTYLEILWKSFGIFGNIWSPPKLLSNCVCLPIAVVPPWKPDKKCSHNCWWSEMIWGFPEIGVPLNHPFIDGFPL